MREDRYQSPDAAYVAVPPANLDRTRGSRKALQIRLFRYN